MSKSGTRPCTLDFWTLDFWTLDIGLLDFEIFSLKFKVLFIILQIISR